MNNSLVPQRRLPDAQELHDLVDEAIAYYIDNDFDFSAYQVTLDLRQENPGIEITHEEVRQRVHYYMQVVYPTLSGKPYYEEDRRYPDGNWALTYTPQPITGHFPLPAFLYWRDRLPKPGGSALPGIVIQFEDEDDDLN